MESGIKKHTVQYWGNAEDIMFEAIELGWKYNEEDYLDEDGYIDWDEAIEQATEFLNNKGITISYN